MLGRLVTDIAFILTILADGHIGGMAEFFLADRTMCAWYFRPIRLLFGFSTLESW